MDKERIIISEMKQKILDVVSTHGGGTTFVELEDNIPEFNGDRSFRIEGRPDAVLWTRMSLTACAALAELLSELKLLTRKSNALVYAMDGDLLKLPITQDPHKVYKKPHWHPVVFWLPERIEMIPEEIELLEKQSA